MNHLRMRVALVVAALGSAVMLMACTLGSEEIVARDVDADYDRADVELRQGESIVLTLDATCEADVSGAPKLTVENRLSPPGDAVQTTLQAADALCAVQHTDGFYRGRSSVQFDINPTAVPGRYEVTTQVRHPMDNDAAYAIVQVKVLSALAPERATSFTATGQLGAIELAWAADSADPQPAESHRLERWSATEGYVPIATLPATASTHTHTGLAADTDFLYRLVPINRHGDGPSRTASARTLASPAPTRLLPLTVEVDGTVPGRVVSQPAGLDCPGLCRLEFTEGSTVTLTATPSANGVVSWSGSPGCSGSGLTVNVPISGNTSCRATFSATPPTVPPGWTSAGSARTVPGLVGAPAIAFDANGEPTVAYVEQGMNSDRGALRVVRRRGTNWFLVGGDPVNVNGPAAEASPALVLLDNGEPVVAWTNAEGQMLVAGWDGSTWVTFGGNIAMGGRSTPASAPQLERSGNSLVAAWTETPSSGPRIVVKGADVLNPSSWLGGPVPGTSGSASVLSRLALDATGRATVLILRTGLNGVEAPLRALEEATGWQAACGDLGTGGGSAGSAIGFAIQRDRLRDDSAVVLRPSTDFRQVLGARCVNGSWQPLGLTADGVIAEADNNRRVLRGLALIPERGGRGPVALVAIANGYQPTTSYVQALLGDNGFVAAPGLERPRTARVGTLGAAAIGAGAIGFVQGFESGQAIELEAWRFAP